MGVSYEQVAAALRTSVKEADRLRKQNKHLLARGSEPIAIVGIGCRFPGGVGSPEGLWELVASGRDGISEFPENRGWEVERIFDPDPEAAGKTYAREGGFLEGAPEFDPAFFSISPREAIGMDPQGKLLLEGAWEAMEHAGIDPASLRGSSTGVFAGVMYHDYGMGSGSLPPDLEAYTGGSGSASIASGGLAYALGFEGPAVTIDTACSSSLVAMHLAAQALRAGECDLALAGGATVMATPAVFIQFSRQRGLSPDGRCKSFSAEADGAGFSEGAGLLLLERLSDAQAKGRRILGVIRGSATNQDGASNGLTAPNGPSQERVIRQALANAGLKPSEVDAVEAHGTGTTLGDPIEAQALLATYGQGRDNGPLALGSLKSNIGHTQAAAGVGGVIKMVMALREEELPRTIHAEEPTPHVDWSAGEIQLLSEPRPWPRSERPRRAGVSSFGMSGTNAHLILEEPPELPVPERDEESRPPAIPWAISAKAPEALGDFAARLREQIASDSLDPIDVAHTLLASRASLPHRAVVVGSDQEELLAGLDALAQGKASPTLAQAKATQGKTAFLLSGQGSQKAQMGKGLYEAFPIYAEAFERACEALEKNLGFSVKEAVFAEAGTELSQSLKRTDLTQASLFAVQVALFELLASFGTSPDYLLGHSIGEVTAAHLSGVLSLEDAAKLVAARGTLMAALPEGGAMASVRATEQEVTESLASFEGKLGIAAVNSPASITVSGDEEALAEWEASQEAEGKKAKRLEVSHAFHSQRMEPMLADFEQLASQLTFNPPRLPIVSNLTGEELSAEQATSPAYWASQVREAVRFADGVVQLFEQGVSRCLELGPGTTLTALAQEALAESDKEGAFAPTLRKEMPEPSSFVAGLGAVYASGGKADLQTLLQGVAPVHAELPRYPFQRQRYWLEMDGGAGDATALGQSPAEHPLLGASISLADEGAHLFTGRVSRKTHAWVGDHAVGGVVVLPGMALCELALRAGAEAGAERLEELVLEAPLPIPEQGAVQLQLTLTPSEDDPERFQLAIYSRPEREAAAEDGDGENAWARHASGTLVEASQASQPGFDATAWPPPGAEPIGSDDFYDRVAEIGLEYGPAFQGLEAAWRLGEELYAEVSLAEEQRGEAERFAVHPALLDAALHPGILGVDPSEGIQLPFSFAGVSLGEARGASALRVRISTAGERPRLDAADRDGVPVVSIDSLVARTVDPAQLRAAGAAKTDALFRVEWPEVELPGQESPEAEVEVFECVPDARLEPAGAAHALAAAALQRLQTSLSGDSHGRLAFLTEGAMAVTENEAPDPAAATVWGLVRSAQSEHPGRFLLVDSDGSEASKQALSSALAIEDEPQLALREGVARAPRLAPVADGVEAEAEPPAFDPEGMVVITGGLSGLGAIAARHLTAEHGVRHMLLASRRGPAAPGADQLIAELAELGCEARAVACDVANGEQVASLVGEALAERSLTAIVHCAGTIDDALVDALDAGRLDAVLAPKADAAWHLHKLTKDLDLAAFVLYSSGAAVAGNPGQGNYAAANSFLDALAARRRCEGLPATSIAWGMWEAESAMTGSLSEADRARLSRGGVAAISTEQGLELLDRALALPDAITVAAPFDSAALRTAARAGILPPLLSALVPAVRRRSRATAGSLARQLAAVPEAEREAAVLLVVREHVAAVLGHPSAEAVDPVASFKDLGFDSLGAVELRNRLAQATGVPLDATLVFDHPTPEAVARHLLDRVRGEAGGEVVVRAARGSDEPIAIVGIGCRYPGGVASPDDLWNLVASGSSGIVEFPDDRGWDLERLYDPDPDKPGKSYVRHGGFMEDADQFDPAFFAISPREALGMDPQQRLLLEAAWAAIERAGIDPASLRRTSTGVYAGMMGVDYGAGSDIFTSTEFAGLLATGLSGSVVSGRLSYALGLEGPAVTIDTACSSSLVAMHLAAQALRAGECELALAGGASVLSTPLTFVEMSQQRALAPDGRCKSFAAEADGTSWSEGCGLVLLERLSDAKRNKRRILATIRGSATNQDGASNGLTAPNGPSQERVIRQALANAGLKPSEVDAVEGHGTGTTLGDPIEAQALLATYGQDRDNGPLALGSLKSNIGHTQAAAGVGGVIKMVMALREEELPRTLNAAEPTPHVDWSAGEIELLTEPREWKRGDRPRRAGISSFGISGTNVHVIIEEPPALPASDRSEQSPPPAIPWAISAKSPEALAEYAGKLAAHAEKAGQDPIDVAHTLLASRASLPHRAVIVGTDSEELLAGLDALAQGKASPTLAQAKATQGKTAFLLSGQGSQRPQMGKGLYEAFPPYAEAFERACEALEKNLGFSVKEAVFAEAGTELSESLRRTDLTQASLFAVQVSLFELLASFGTSPDYLLGHSIGEVTAAHLSGVLSLEDAAKLVAARGTLMAALPEGGAMASVRATEQEVTESLSSFAGKLGIAAVNSPASITVSGDEEALAEWEALQETEGRKTKRLEVSHAFHSQRMEPMLAELEQIAATLTFNPPKLPIVSNLSGEELSAEQATSPAYWASQVREAVRFADGVVQLFEQGVSRCLELGPGTTLTALAQEALAESDKEGAFAPTLRKELPEAQSLVASLGTLHASGATVDWSRLLGAAPPLPAELPTYAFQRRRYWLEAGRIAGDATALGQSPTEHPLLGASISLAGEGAHLFTGRVSQSTHPWVGDHAVAGNVLLPGAALAELALSAGGELGAECLEELILEAPLLVPEGSAVQIQLTLTAQDGDRDRLAVAIHSRPERAEEEEGEEERPWTRHAQGILIAQEQPPAPPFEAAWPPSGAEPIGSDDFYDRVAEIGLEYGPAFQGLEAAWRLGEELYAEVSLAEEQRGEAERFAVHPALLDAALHPGILGVDPSEGIQLPFSFAGVSLGEARGASALRVRISTAGERPRLDAADRDGVPAFSIDSLLLRPVDPSQLRAQGAGEPEALFALEWAAVELGEGEPDDVETFECRPEAGLDPAAAAHLLGARALEAIQAFLGDETKAESRLAILTTTAMAVAGEEVVDPAAAAVWGLVRSAQSEHPGRFLLVDSDGSEASQAALPRALAQEEEPQLALREGAASAPRLVAVEDGDEAEPAELGSGGTVLITGGLSGIGAIAARHLATSHEAKRMLLTSRRGPEAPGAAGLIAELAELGCEATAVACDVAERSQVEELLARVSAEHPLSVVVHCAGVLDDGTIELLDPSRLDTVLAPKADGAWHLHELTAGIELSQFVLYSSAAGTAGTPGQGNYAAANSFLDALSYRRCAEGLPATSIAWGMWEADSEMTGELSEADRTRLARTGGIPIGIDRGLELFDRVRSQPRPLSLAIPLDKRILRTVAQAGLLPPLFSKLVPAARRRAKKAGSLARRLATIPEAEREAAVLRLVREHVASVLGHPSADAVDPQANFKDLGFDSLGAVELRNRLAEATGVRLDATLVFDYPNAAAVARYLLAQVEGDVGAGVAVRAARGTDEPIAIVGLSCRYPGGVASPQGLWKLVASGGDGIVPFPEDRGWDVEAIYDPDPEQIGKSYVNRGCFMRDATMFDPAFFGISPREALAMDPQQRLYLEGAWEALEDAGLDPASLRGTSTGVFAGMMGTDYAAGTEAFTSAELSGLLATGLSSSVASGRIAYALGLEGPAMTIDTACSSSLVAMHLAAQALRGGECDLALAGGTTVLSTPLGFLEMSRQRVLAPDASCKAFGAEADGASWSEGAGLLLLERLSDAKRNKRRILAVIRGSATNQDGASNGLTAPNGPSQERVIRQALANAGLKPSEVDAVEAHGTGTPLGDPIEAQALLATYGQDRDNGPLALGSLKSNIGHTQAGAGVGGVIKMVMALREEELPKTLHAEEPTPHVDWDAGEVELLSEPREWKRGDRPRRAGVSSFGISGTNAHVILEEPPEPPALEREDSTRPVAIPWAISAKTPEALRDYAGLLAAHAEKAGQDPIDVAHTLLASRASLPHRAVVVGEDTEELLAGLDALAQGKASPTLAQAKATSRSKIAFVFPGQGSQWAGMAKGLLAESEVFARRMAECEEALAPYVDFSLGETIRSAEEQWLGQVEVVQPALFAVMVSLAELWRSFGVEPQAVIGHSQGEIAAAVVAGALSLQDGAKLAALRAKALIPLMGKGDMASFAASPKELEGLIEPYGDRVSIAAQNGPRSTVLSGEPEALEELVASCEEEGTRARIIPVGYASHCAQIEAIREELEAGIEGIQPQSSEVLLYSTLSGEPIDTASLDAAYWYRNLREPVQFEQATQRLLEDGFTAFVEISAHPVLAMALEETAEAGGKEQVAALHTLRREEGSMKRFLASLGQAHASGVEVDFSSLFEAASPTLTELPTYPFQRQRYWLEPSQGAGDLRAAGQSATDHPLLGASIALAQEGEHLFTGRISQKTHPWTKDHAVAANVILPGTAFVELALGTGAEVGAGYLEELVLEAPLPIPEEGGVQLRVTLAAKEEDPGRFGVEIHSRPEGREGAEDEEEEHFWTRHASGVLVAQGQPATVGFDATAWPPPTAESIPIDDFYDRVAEIGIEYGPAFQGLEAAWRLGEELYAEVSLAEEQGKEAERFGIHPALLDAALHASMLGADPAAGIRLPFSFGGVSLGEASGAAALRVRVRKVGERIAIDAAGPDGATVGSIESLAVIAADPSQLPGAASEPDSLFALQWAEVELAEAEQSEVEVFECHSEVGVDSGQAAHALSAQALEAIQAFLADEAKAESRLAFLTQGAMSLAEGDAPDPAGAAIWGLVRSAQTEHPGRFLLIDSDASEASKEALPKALSQQAEPQLALREGAARAPRLVAVADGGEAEPAELGSGGTVLITGGLSGIGAITARHLATSHGAKHLLLTSRRGPEAPGAAELLAELAELGCEATAIACDVSERSQLEALLAQVPAEHPLTAVVHSAGVLADGTIASLDAAQLDAVLSPKADAAWHLHELTREDDLTAFVLYSSAAAVFGNPGQGNYAAANSFLDALAQRRRAEGLPATSIAWGMWEAESGMTGELSDADRGRLARGGVTLISTEHGLALFDRACAQSSPALAAVPLDKAALRPLARAGLLPPLLSGLVPVGKRRSSGGAGFLAKRLATVPEDKHEAVVLELVRDHAAAVLGHESAAAIDPTTNFQNLGFDSLAAVELRNRLAEATGVRLDATMVFDYPNAGAVAGYLLGQVRGEAGAAAVVRAARGTDEPIAIVGIGCRYPGGVSSREELWRLVAGGSDGISEFPEDRGWDVEAIYDPDADSFGKTYAREGGFLADAAEFDPAFFGISPREALIMDPQQRLLLEGTWEALEDAGVKPASLHGSATGVFAGMMGTDFGAGADLQDYSSAAAFLSTGASASVMSGRVSYALGLVGPAVTIDTACSSSLVAMHLAAQALRGGECDLALASGVTVMNTPMLFMGMSIQRVLAPDGRCKSFAAGADGAGFSEGAGVLLLERLSDAKANKRRILATIRGSATNQDGASNGLTAPNGPSQERVIRQALANAGLKPSEVDAVEAHGTGTTLGDPIEAQALLATYGQERENGPLALGSLKSNIGHTQAAAGVGGVIKMVMALREEELPRTLHAAEPTPHVDWSAGEVELLTEAKEWKRGDRPRRAGISSFGISGTNAHVIIEEPPELPAPEREGSARPPAIPWAISAKSPEALAAYAGKLAAHAEKAGQDPIDVAHTLLASRASLPHRAVIVGSDQEELLAGLDALAQGKASPSLAQAKATAHSKIAFVFPGQGSQWAGMAKGLLRDSEPFAAAMAKCEEALAPFVDFSLTETLCGEDEQWLGQVEVLQPALFAVMVSLAELWRSFGVEPQAVIGHSQGEIAAAVVAGALSLDDGAKLAALRAKALIPLMGKGEMASFAASPKELGTLIEPYGDRVSIAAKNGPRSTVLSGEPEALEELVASCEQEGTRARILPVGYASHCAQIEAIREELEAGIEGIQPQPTQTPFYSTLCGEPIDTASLDAAYWYRNLREPVQFEQATQQLLADGFSAFVEISAHPVLTMALEQSAEAQGQERLATLHTLRRDEGDMKRFLTSLGQAHASGVEVDFSPLFEGLQPTHAELPTYPFQRQRYWLQASQGTGDLSAAGQSATDHPLLGASIALAAEGSHLFTGRVSPKSHPWVKDHAVAGTVILPGTAFVEMAIRAGEEVGAGHLQELVLEAPLLLGEQGATQLQLTLTPQEGDPDSYAVEIHSRPEPGQEGEEESAFTRHACGTLTAQGQPLTQTFDTTTWPPPGAEPIPAEDFYDRVAEVGIEYGPAFQGLEAAWRLGEETYAEVSLAEEQGPEAGRFGVHPALFDAALHPCFLGAEAAGAQEGLALPFSFSGVTLGEGRGGSQLRVRVSSQNGQITLDAADASGVSAVSIGTISVLPVKLAQLPGAASEPDSLFALQWAEVELAEAEQSEVEVFECHSEVGVDSGQAAHALSAQALEAIQAFLADEAKAESRLAFLTQGAMSLAEGDAPDPAGAAIWGLVRSAQTEHPGRFLLIDSDASEASKEALPKALSQQAEPQLALREGAARAPRLVAVADGGEAEPAELGSGGTVLITGGLSGIGAITARHLATSHGAKHLLLTSRRGPEAPGAAELLAELAELGCEATAIACDVSERSQLEALLAQVPAEHPLTAVVHSAGVLADGTIASLDAAQLDAVLSPKADAAWHLHELTREDDLTAFVLYSSAAAVFGNPGQGNYAAANSFLDALAQRRRAEGLPATSIAWGMWEAESGMTGELSDADRGRLARMGLVPIASQQGMELFDRVRSGSASLGIAMPLDTVALRPLARAGLLPPLFSSLIPAGRKRAKVAKGSLLRRLENVAEEDRKAVVMTVVREQVASVLGHSGADAVDPERNLLELGFDSLSAVDLRNRLAAIADVQLPPTVAFEHPTPVALAEYLTARLADGGSGAGLGAAGGAEQPGGTLRALLAHAHSEGKTTSIVPLLVEASKLQPSFESTADLDELPRVTPIFGEGTAPRLVCVPSFVVGSGPHQFARLAQALDGRRKVVALSLPGSRRGEALPASWDVAMDALTESVLRAAEDEPFALVGYSSGGAVARALAERLERDGKAPAALAMIDSYLPDGAAMVDVFSSIMGGLLEMDQQAVAIDDDHLIAMGGYMRLLAEWEPASIGVPALMLRATRGQGADLESEGAVPEWQRPATTVDVVGDHFSLISDDSGATADAIESWLVSQLELAQGNDPMATGSR